MRKLLKGIIWALVLFTVVYTAGGYVLPGEAVVQRSIAIAAPPEKVFAIVGNLRRFNEWSPWADLDAATAYTFDGPESGVGQKMTWASNNPNVGVGSQEIVEVVANASTVTLIDFGQMGQARATLALSPAAEGTAVTWGFRTELKGASERWLGLMFDRWIGADYEKGLQRLKSVAEAAAGG